MFLLNFLPDFLIIWVVNAILISGIIGTIVSVFFGFFSKWIPQLYPVRLPLQVISIVLLVVGVYFKGGAAVELEWRAKVAALEAKVAIAEQQAKDANGKIVEKIVERVRVVKDTQVVVQEKLKIVEVKVDAQCKVAPEVITILNDAAATPRVNK